MSAWKPEGYPSMSPYLICKDAESVIGFATQVLGAEVLRRFDHPDGSVMHTELRIDDSILMIGGGATDMQSDGAHLHVYVPDAAAVFERAVAAGATVIQEPARSNDDDDLRGGVRDASGTSWWFASQPA